MKLMFLGTGGYHPSDTRETVCAFLPEYGIVLDAGTGCYRLRDKIATPNLDIFLSHLHLDHCIGTTYLLDVLWGKDQVDVTVFGLKKHLEYLKNNLFDSPLFPIPWGSSAFPHSLEGLTPPEVFERRGVKIATKKLAHPGDAVGYRFEFQDGKTLCYITDTTSSDDYIDLIQNADTVIHECNFPDRLREHAVKTGHSWTSGVAELAKKAGVKKLILTHFNPLDTSHDPTHQDVAEIRFPNTVIAEDGLTIDL